MRNNIFGEEEDVAVTEDDDEEMTLSNIYQVQGNMTEKQTQHDGSRTDSSSIVTPTLLSTFAEDYDVDIGELGWV